MNEWTVTVYPDRRDDSKNYEYIHGFSNRKEAKAHVAEIKGTVEVNRKKCAYVVRRGCRPKN